MIEPFTKTNFAAACTALAIASVARADDLGSNPPSDYEEIPFTVRDNIADRERNLVYFTENSGRIFALSTDTGVITAATATDGTSSTTGTIAVSPSGDELFVALDSSDRIQVLNLPDLTTKDVVHLDFAARRFVCGADGYLYFLDASEGLRKVDPISGNTISTTGGRPDYYDRIKTDSTGRRLFLLGWIPPGVGGRSAEMEIVDGSMPVLTRSLDFTLGSNTRDVVIDEVYERIYSTAGGTYGISSFEMGTGVSSYWAHEIDPYGNGVAVLGHSITSTSVFGMSGVRQVRQFRRSNGTPMNDHFMARSSPTDATLEVTPNGRVVYVSGGGIGIFGLASLDLDMPNDAPLAIAGSDFTTTPGTQTLILGDAVDLTSAASMWEKVSGPGDVAFSNPTNPITHVSFERAGTYVIRLAVSDGALSAQDLVHVVVEGSAPSDVNVFASDPLACEYMLDPGEFRVTIDEARDEDLTIDLMVSGSADPQHDFAPLPTQVTIPSGQMEIGIPVSPVADEESETSESIIIDLLPSGDYEIGAASTATVQLQNGDYECWKQRSFELVDVNNPLVSGPAVDCDNDGRNNWIEFLQGTDPKTPEGNDSLLKVAPLSIGGGDYITCSFRMAIGVDGATFHVEVGSGLGQWSRNTFPNEFTGIISKIPNGDGSEWVTARTFSRIGDHDAYYLRLASEMDQQ